MVITSNCEIEVRESQVSDKEQIILAMVELQNFERSIEPLRLPGEQMAEAYVDKLLKELQANNGKIFVAVCGSQLAGFIAIRDGGSLDLELNEPVPTAYITDIVVMPQFRKQGVGAKLMLEAEKYATSLGVKAIKIEVLIANVSAHSLYRKAGYTDYTTALLKWL